MPKNKSNKSNKSIRSPTPYTMDPQHDNCVICMEPLNSKLYIDLPCHHMFHKECFDLHKITSHGDLCPICRVSSAAVRPVRSSSAAERSAESSRAHNAQLSSSSLGYEEGGGRSFGEWNAQQRHTTAGWATEMSGIMSGNVRRAAERRVAERRAAEASWAPARPNQASYLSAHQPYAERQRLPNEEGGGGGRETGWEEKQQVELARENLILARESLSEEESKKRLLQDSVYRDYERAVRDEQYKREYSREENRPPSSMNDWVSAWWLAHPVHVSPAYAAAVEQVREAEARLSYAEERSSEKCSSGRCAVMGGKIKRRKIKTYKIKRRKTKRRKTRIKTQ